MYYFNDKLKNRHRFLCSDTDKERLEQKIQWYIEHKSYEQEGTLGKEVDPFNGRTRYFAVLRKKVEQ